MIPVAGDSLDLAIIPSEGNIESNDGVAGLDEVQVLFWDVSL